jgi:hypothetical protein
VAVQTENCKSPSIPRFTLSLLRLRSDDVALASGRLHAGFQTCLKRKSKFFSNSDRHPDGCTLELFRNFSTLMGAWTDTRDLNFTELSTAQNLPRTLKLPS